MKLLTDFKVGKTYESADRCEECAETHKVTPTYIEGNFGVLKIVCACGEDSDLAGWEYMDKPIIFFGKEIYPYSGTNNIALCLNCEKFVVGGPLILYTREGKWQINFCFDCAKKLELFTILKEEKP